jgi:hypothetical protein
MSEEAASNEPVSAAPVADAAAGAGDGGGQQRPTDVAARPDDAAELPESGAPAKAEKDEAEEEGKYIKVGDEEVSVDVLTEAYTKAAEVAQREESLQTFISNFKESPADSVLALLVAQHGDKRAGYNALVKLCDEVLSYHIGRESMPEAERKLLEQQEEAEELRRRLAEKEEAEKSREREMAEAEATERISKNLKEAITKHGLPDSGKIRQRITQIMVDAIDAGLTKVSADEAARRVKAKIELERKEAVQYVRPEDLTPEQLELIKKHTIAGAKLAGTKTAGNQQESGNIVHLPRRSASVF